MTAATSQYLTFTLAGEEYAFGILRVREILEYDTLTRVPNAPAGVRGVINLRGRVVPVVDLAQPFGLEPTVTGARTCVVIVEVQAGEEQVILGVLADTVQQVVDLSPADIEPAPSFGTRVRLDYLQGVGKADGQRFVMLLDVDRLLGGMTVSDSSEHQHTKVSEVHA